MAPADGPDAQMASDRAARAGDAASQALNEALRVSFWLLKFAMVGVVVLFILSGCYEVKEYERAIVLRFGRVVYTTDPETREKTAVRAPGWHLAWPFLIDEVVRFPSGVLQEPLDVFWYREREETGHAAKLAGIKPGTEGYNLTGDANILHSRWRISYRINDPLKFVTHLADPSLLADEKAAGVVRALLHSLLRNAVIRTMARYDVDDAYRRRKAALQDDVERELRRQLSAQDVGVVIVENGVVLSGDGIVPPRQAKEAFDDVISAAQERDEMLRDAEGKASEIVNQADADASRIKAKAAAYKVRKKEQADADAAYITDLRKTFPDDPQQLDIFLEQRLIEILEETLKDAEEVYVVRPGPGGRREIRLYVKPDPKLVAEKSEKPKKP